MFLDTLKITYIKNVIKSIFSNLNTSEFIILSNNCYSLIDYIHTKFLIKPSDNEKFFEQLKRNNNREIIAIMNLLLPYIDDTNDYEKYKKINSLEDITIKKNAKGEYDITNFQYSRGCEINEKFEEYKFSRVDILMNYQLLSDTIKEISYKMYVNWVNVIPVLLEKYHECQLYKNSVEFYIRNNAQFENTSLQIDDIHDVFVNDLYYSIIDIKWLLFEKYENNNVIMYLDIIHDIYNIYDIIDDSQNTKWLLLDINKKNIFIENMNNLYKSANANIGYKKYSPELTRNFMYYFLLFFDMNYKFKNDITGYQKIINEDDENIHGYEDDDAQIRTQNIVKLFENYDRIDKYYLYDFLRSNLLKLKKTWYGFKIFKNNKKINKLHEYTQSPTPDFTKLEHRYNSRINLNRAVAGIVVNISYKNIYNYAKSLLFVIFNINTVNPNHLLMITLNYKSKFNPYNNQQLQRDIYDYLTNALSRSFNIRRNLVKKYGNLINPRNINRSIYDWICNININNSIYNILEITFECLAKRGLLTEYVIRDEKFEKSKMNNEYNKSEFFKHIEKYKNAYYYLTDDTYDNLPKIYNRKKLKEETYFERLKEQKWYNFYAMDWVSQINFYHHYINNRIVMLTGGTGVGKSTQVPKLLLYGLKAIDKIFDGKIICTQPRISPTIDNTKNIARELGVDIENYNPIYKKFVKTTMGIIQYKYEGDDHIDDDQEYYLRIVTDGTLLVELKESLLLKVPVNQKKSKFDITSNKIYGLKNIYNIVIIDESHEHNANMDLILSIMRGTIFLNNQISLYIVSATMESDDPIYRKYFRYINDNLKYPLKIDHLEDRIIIDRRVHISPPGEGTQYNIKEIYNDIDLEEDKAYEKAKEYAVQICNTNSPINNDILLFCTTKTQIIKLTNDLNIVLPSDTIAIPFYRDLPQTSKDIITSNLDEIKNNFYFDRKYINDVLTEKIKKEDLPIGNKYSRILIISTNIAEASITINSLKFVIDTGFNNDVSYNYETYTSNNKIIPISEASRKQRKGRVGRVADGTVYYTYKKHSRENIKPQYGICKTNFCDNFLLFLEEDSLQSKIYDDGSYPYSYDKRNIPLNIQYNRLIGNLDTQRQINNSTNDNNIKTIYKLNLFYAKFLIHQYFIYELLDDDNNYNNDIFYSDRMYNYNLITPEIYNNIIPFVKYGISSQGLLDKNLGFYLIHPFENEIILLRNKKTNLLDNEKISVSTNITKKYTKSLLNPLFYNMYLYRPRTEIISKVKVIDYLNQIKSKTDKLIEMNLIYPLIVSIKFNLFDNVLFIIYFLKKTNYDILSVVENLEVFLKIFKSPESDLLVINKIFDLFKTSFGHLLFEKNFDIIKEKQKGIFKQNFNNFKDKNYNKLKFYDYNKLIKMLLKNDDEDTFIEGLLKSVKIEETPSYIEIEIKNWCKTYGINYLVFSEILKVYIERYYLYKSIFNDDVKNEKYVEYIKKSTIENELSIERNIIKSFIYGNKDKLFIYENNVYNRFDEFLNNEYIYNKNNFNKKWISNVTPNRFMLVLNLENDRKPTNIKNDILNNDEETENKKIIINILSSIDSKLYAKINYINDNPSTINFGKLDDINHNFICNNPISIENNKHPDDPKLNEYINILKKSMKDYIDNNC
jgi:hypothetical protein